MTISMLCLGAAAGFALCWFTKDKLVMAVTGTHAFVDKLEAKAKALKAAISS